jgi:endonuclease YncB( thermonuclease family)
MSDTALTPDPAAPPPEKNTYERALGDDYGGVMDALNNVSGPIPEPGPPDGVGVGDNDLYGTILDGAEFDDALDNVDSAVGRKNSDPKRQPAEVWIDPSAPRSGRLEGVRIKPKPTPEEIDAIIMESLSQRRGMGSATGTMIGNISGGKKPGQDRGFGPALGDMVGRVGSDLRRSRPALEILGGVRDATQEFIETLDLLNKGVASASGIDPQNAFWGQINFAGRALLSQLFPDANWEEKAAEALGDTSDLKLPEVASSNTVTGNFIRKTAQFLTGFAAGGSGLKAVGVTSKLLAGGTAGRITDAALRGAISDFFFFDEMEGSLIDVAKEAGLDGPLVDFLASDPDDPAVVNKLRRTLDGIGFGVLTDSAIAGIKLLSKARRAKAALQKELSETARRSVISNTLSETPRTTGEIIGEVQGFFQSRVDEAALSPEAKRILAGMSPEMRADGFNQVAKSAGLQDAYDLLDGDALAAAQANATPDAGYRKFTEHLSREAEKLSSEAIVEEVDTLASRFQNRVDDTLRRTYPNKTDEELGKMLAEEVIDAPGSGKLLVGPSKFVVNLDRIEGDEDMKKLIAQTTLLYDPDAQAMRGGPTRSWGTVESAAGDVSGYDVIEKMRVGEPLSDVQTLALRDLHAALADRSKDLRKAVLADGGNNPMLGAEYLQAYTMFKMVNDHVAGARAEAGRSLNIWRMMAKVKRAGSAREIREAMEEVGDKSAFSLAMVDEAAEAHSGAAGRVKLTRAQEYYGKTRDTLLKVFYFNILSGVKTQVRNFIGSGSMFGIDMFEQGFARRLAELGGDEAALESLGSAMDTVAGMKAGFWDGMKAAGQVIRTGDETFAKGSAKLGEMHTKQMLWSGKGMSKTNPLKWILDVTGALPAANSRVMSASDQFWSGIAFGSEIERRAGAKVRQEVASGALEAAKASARRQQLISAPTKDMLDGALDKVKYLTFRDDSGAFVKTLNNLKRTYPMMNLVIPFTTIVGNLMKRGVERTPLAPAMGGVRGAWKQGGAEAYVATARALTGTFLIGLGMDLTFAGKLSGPGPTEVSERKRWRERGMQPYALKLNEKLSMGINGMDPLGWHLLMGASIGEAMLNDSEGAIPPGEWGEVITEAAFGAAHTVYDKSLLTGVSGLIQAIEDPDRSAYAYASRMAGSLLVPNIVRDVATFMDPQQRQAYGFWQNVVAKLPYFREGLAVVRDNHGRPISYRSSMGSLYDTISPLYMSEYKPEPIDVVMMKDGTRLTTINPVLKRGEVSINLRKHPTENSRFYELVGQTRPSQYAAPPMTPVNDIDVIDGDSFWATDRNGNRIKYRLSDVDTPEVNRGKDHKDYAKGMEAKAALQRVLTLAQVNVRTLGLGPNGETVAKVTIEGDINQITGGPTSDRVGDALIRLNLLKEDQSSTKETRIAADLANEFGDRTRLEALNAIVSEDDPGGPISDYWKKFQEADTSDKRDSLIAEVEDAYREAAKQALLIEFPWIEKHFNTPVEEDVSIHPMEREFLKGMEQR